MSPFFLFKAKECHPVVILHSIVALEKFSQTSQYWFLFLCFIVFKRTFYQHRLTNVRNVTFSVPASYH